MKESDVPARAFAMPLTSPAFPPGPYRFRQREYLIIAYRTDPDKLRALVPEPLEVDEPVVKYEPVSRVCAREWPAATHHKRGAKHRRRGSGQCLHSTAVVPRL